MADPLGVFVELDGAPVLAGKLFGHRRRQVESATFTFDAGFLADSLPPVPEDQEDELIAPIVKHVNDVITGGNAAHTKWVLDYIANMIQRPERKSQVAISLYGAQGCGKGIIFEFLRQKVLGEECSFQTSKPHP